MVITNAHSIQSVRSFNNQEKEANMSDIIANASRNENLDWYSPVPLYCRYDGQLQTQPAFVELDTRSGEYFFDYSSIVGNGVPEDVVNGVILRFNVNPCLSSDALKDAEDSDELQQLMQQALDAENSDNEYLFHDIEAALSHLLDDPVNLIAVYDDFSEAGWTAESAMEFWDHSEMGYDFTRKIEKLLQDSKDEFHVVNDNPVLWLKYELEDMSDDDFLDFVAKYRYIFKNDTDTQFEELEEQFVDLQKEADCAAA